MSKQNNVGAGPVSARNKQNGITLIALIITIIVMLILVGVTVSVSLNGGLFTKAKQAGEDYETEVVREAGILNEPIEIDGKKYASYQDYLNNSPMVDIELPEGWRVTTTPATWTKADGTINDKVIAITDGTYIVPLPDEYQVSLEEGEGTVAEGLVITDGENEFVWIPIAADTTFANPYNEGEPTTYYDTEERNLTEDYTEMVTSVEKYDGFYIARYETTIDGTKIGSKENASLYLSWDWEPMYNALNDANVKGNGDIVQTCMLWGQQFDVMLSFFDNQNKDYSGTPVENMVTAEELQNSGQAKYSYDNKTISDKICNIYDLRGNAEEITASMKAFYYDVEWEDGTGFDTFVSFSDPYFIGYGNQWSYGLDHLSSSMNSPGPARNASCRFTLYIK